MHSVVGDCDCIPGHFCGAQMLSNLPRWSFWRGRSHVGLSLTHIYEYLKHYPAFHPAYFHFVNKPKMIFF